MVGSMSKELDWFRDKVGTTIGEASMLWSEIPHGVFNSTKAQLLSERLLNDYEALLTKISLLKQDYESLKRSRSVLFETAENIMELNHTVNKEKYDLEQELFKYRMKYGELV